MLDEVVSCLGCDLLFISKRFQLGKIGHNKSDKKRFFLPGNHYLIDIFVFGNQLLDGEGSDVFATGCYDNMFLSVCDFQILVFVKLSDIACVEPSVINDLIVCFLVIPVAFHDIRTAEQYFAVAVDFNSDIVNNRANSSELDLFRPVDIGDR